MAPFEFSWYLPCDGDGHWTSTAHPEREPTLPYLADVAAAAEGAGFDSILVPVAFSSSNYSPWAPRADAILAAATALQRTSRVRVILAQRPGFVNPGVFAMMCASLDRASAGRVALNIVTAGAPGDMEQFGDELTHDARYARAEEFVDVLLRLWSRRTTDFDGVYYRMTAARLEPKPASPPLVYLAGASDAALRMAARQADVYMMSAETVEGIGRRIADLRERAAALGRSPRFCVAATMFASETDEKARLWAREFAGHADLAVLAERQGAGRVDSAVENLRFRAGTNVETWLAPNLWSGISHLIYGSAWVGSYEALADLFVRYAEVGVSVFQIYGYPFLEEATHIGERFVPLARSRLAALADRVAAEAASGND
jgi:alkanesulfonate monooxygenase